MSDQDRDPGEGREPETDSTEELGPGTAPTEQRPAAEQPARAGRVRRLLPTRDDRMITGVAGGLAEYFAVDPVIIRIAFGVSILFGGLGLVAYLALSLFVPSDDGSEHPQAPVQSSRMTAAVGVLFLLLIAIPAIGGGLLWGGAEGVLWAAIPVALGIAIYAAIRDRGGSARGTLWAVVVAGSATVGLLGLMAAAAFVTALGHGVVTGLALAGLGILLVALALAGGGRWLVLPALAIGLGTGIATASDIDLGGGIGERVYRPATAASIPADGYELGVGRLAIDLRDLDWRGEAIDLDADLGIGQLYVAVPERVCVIADAKLRAGQIDIAGERTDGFEVAQSAAPTRPAGPALRLHADQEVGEIKLVNDDSLSLESHRPWDDGSISAELLRDRNAEACAR